MESRTKRTLSDHPKLLAQCHPTLNINLRLRGKIILLSEIPEESTLKIWWKCETASDHIWEAGVSSRTKYNKSGCLFCKNRPGYVSITNSIPENYPEIAEEWHPTKNSKGMDWWTYWSQEKVWWKCSKCDCEWEAIISKRTRRNQGCPCCSNPPRRVTPHNCLASHKNLGMVTELWDYERNKNGGTSLLVMNVDGIENMTRDLTPETITPFSNKRDIYWICSKGKHESFPSSPSDMVRSCLSRTRGCPKCASKKISREKSLGVLLPSVNEIWSKENPKSPYEVFSQSNEEYLFDCPKGPDHKWPAPAYEILNNRLKNPGSNGCPFCSGQKVSITNRLDLLYPELAKEWHPDNPMGPDDVTYGYNGSVTWKCKNKKGHVWMVAVNNRVDYSRKRKVSEYNIQIYGTKGCKECKLVQTSRQEKRLAFEFYALFGMESDKTDVRIAESNCRPDILISPNGLRNRGIISDAKGLIIEWDSRWFHKDLNDREKADKRKSDELERLQYIVIRIREDMDLVNPENDIKVKKFEKIKNIVDEVTKKIEEIFAMKIPVFETYRKSESLLDKEAEEKINDLDLLK